MSRKKKNLQKYTHTHTASHCRFGHIVGALVLSEIEKDSLENPNSHINVSADTRR